MKPYVAVIGNWYWWTVHFLVPRTMMLVWSLIWLVINQHLFTLTGTRLVTCPFTFYHMTTHMILSSLSLLSLIYIPMESSRISIAPYDDTLFIVLTCSTLIPTYAKVFLTIRSLHHTITIGWLDTSLIPTHSDWMIVYLVNHMDAYLSMLVTVYLLCI